MDTVLVRNFKVSILMVIDLQGIGDWEVDKCILYIEQCHNLYDLYFVNMFLEFSYFQPCQQQC